MSQHGLVISVELCITREIIIASGREGGKKSDGESEKSRGRVVPSVKQFAHYCLERIADQLVGCLAGQEDDVGGEGNEGSEKRCS